MDLCSSSKQLNDHVTPRWMAVFEKYIHEHSTLLDFSHERDSITTCGPVFGENPATTLLLARRQGGNMVGVAGRSWAICLVPILSVATLSRVNL